MFSRRFRCSLPSIHGKSLMCSCCNSNTIAELVVILKSIVFPPVSNNIPNMKHIVLPIHINSHLYWLLSYHEDICTSHWPSELCWTRPPSSKWSLVRAQIKIIYKSCYSLLLFFSLSNIFSGPIGHSRVKTLVLIWILPFFFLKIYHL